MIDTVLLFYIDIYSISSIYYFVINNQIFSKQESVLFFLNHNNLPTIKFFYLLKADI